MNLKKKIDLGQKKYLLILILFLIFFYSLYLKNNQSWQYLVPQKIGSHNLHVKSLFFDDKNLFFSNQINSIFSIDQNTGTLNWSFTSDSYTPFKILIEEDSVFVANFDSYIHRLDKKTGLPIWSYAIPNQFLPDTPIFTLPEDKLLFFADRGGVLSALDKETGLLVWDKQFETLDTNKKFTYGEIHFGFIKEDERYLYVNNFPEEKLFVIEKESGDIGLEIPWEDQQILTYSLELNYLIVDKKESNQVVFYDLNKDLKEVYAFKIRDKSESNFFINENKREVFFQSENKIFLNSLDTGEENWQKEISKGEGLFAFSEDLNIVLSQIADPLNFKAYLRAVSWENGREVWRTELLSEIEAHFIFEDKLVFLSPEQELIFINLKSGEIEKQHHIEGKIKQFFLYELYTDYLIVLSQNEDEKMIINCFTLKDNKHLWSYRGELDLSKKEFQAYQNNDRLYYLNEERFLIESIRISSKEPSPKKVKKLNFDKTIDLKHRILRNVDFEIKENSLLFKLKRVFNSKLFFLKNLNKLNDLEIQTEINDLENLELTVNLEQNLYPKFNQDVQIEGDLYFEGEKISTNKAFYYGLNTWKLRFKLDQAGDYEWKIKIKTPYFIKRREAEFSVSDISQKKNLRIENKHFFLGEDLFWPLGLEDWMNDQNYDGNPFNDFGNADKLQPEIEKESFKYMEFSDYLSLYKEEAGLNVFRFGVGNAKPSLWRSFDNNYFFPDVKNGISGDYLTETVKEKDYQLIMTIFAFDPPFTDYKFFKQRKKREAIRQYLDYVIARYSSRVDIWEIANESSPSLDWLNFVSDYLVENDPYHHPITTNWPRENLNNSDLLSIHWYSPIVFSNLDLEKEVFWLQKQYASSEKAKLISELGFKNKSFFPGSVDQMRKMIWLNTFHLTGSIFWNQPLGISTNPDNANIFLGPQERKELKILNEFLPKETSSFKQSYLSVEDKVHVYLLSNEDYVLAYALNLSNKKHRDLSLEIPFPEGGEVEWINPKYGNIVEKSFVKKGSESLKIPAFVDDLVLKITLSSE